jgi:hypothetical protein
MLEELADGESDNEPVLLTGNRDRLRMEGPNRCVGETNDAGAEDHESSELTKIYRIMFCEVSVIILRIGNGLARALRPAGCHNTDGQGGAQTYDNLDDTLR